MGFGQRDGGTPERCVFLLRMRKERFHFNRSRAQKSSVHLQLLAWRSVAASSRVTLSTVRALSAQQAGKGLGTSILSTRHILSSLGSHKEAESPGCARSVVA